MHEEENYWRKVRFIFDLLGFILSFNGLYHSPRGKCKKETIFRGTECGIPIREWQMVAVSLMFVGSLTNMVKIGLRGYDLKWFSYTHNFVFITLYAIWGLIGVTLLISPQNDCT